MTKEKGRQIFNTRQMAAVKSKTGMYQNALKKKHKLTYWLEKTGV